MPKEVNRPLRIVVPILLALIAIGSAIAVAVNTGKSNTPTTPAASTTSQAAQPKASDAAAQVPSPTATTPAPGPATTSATTSAPAPAATSASTQAPAAPTTTAALAPPFTALVFPADDAAARNFAPLGSRDDQSPFLAELDFSPVGAGVRAVVLNRHRDSIAKDAALVTIQAEGKTVDGKQVLTPMSALAVEINGFVAALAGSADAPVWRQVGVGAFEAFVQDSAGNRIARVTRTYRLIEGSYNFNLEQRLENLTTTPMKVRWYQAGPVDLPMDSKGYGGDKRRVRFGYLLSPRSDPAQESVLASDFLISRMDALGKRADRSGPYLAEKPQWPNSTSQEEGLTLVWFGMTNRYFGVAVHPLIPADGSIAPGAQGRAFRTIEKVDRIVLDQGFDADGNSLETVALRTMSPMLELAPGSAADLSQAVFAGPLSKPTIRADKVKDALNLEGLVVYNFGGPCGPCTFTFLTSLLIWLLRSLHDYVLFDWALAVAVLVVIVRGVLHPVTRWSQKRMTRFGKRMQEVAPKQKKLQEKYKGDSKKLQEETAKLWREEGVSPLGFLGCIPMFLQMPIWIALYATLYFASEMRHEPALFGIFQSITGGSWKFLADLAEPDAFISFGRDFHVPLLSGILGPIGSLNVLPIVLGFVYYAHQKYFTPPSTVQLTPEQETTQKITKWMMVVMFPLFMYNAPSGLAIYFIVNSTLGIFESRWIRHLVDTEDKHLAELAKQGKKPPRKESFWERAMRLAEEQKKAKESMNRGRGGKR